MLHISTGTTEFATLKVEPYSRDLPALRARLGRGMHLLVEADHQLELLSHETLPTLSKRLNLLRKCRLAAGVDSGNAAAGQVNNLVATTTALLPLAANGESNGRGAYQRTLVATLTALTNSSPEATLFREEAGRVARTGLEGLHMLSPYCTGLPCDEAQAVLERVLALSLLENLETLDEQLPQELCEQASEVLRQLRGGLLETLGAHLQQLGMPVRRHQGELTVLLRVFSLAALDRLELPRLQPGEDTPPAVSEEVAALWWKDFRLLRALDRTGLNDSEKLGNATKDLHDASDGPYVLASVAQAKRMFVLQEDGRPAREALGARIFGLSPTEVAELPGEGLELLAEAAADLPAATRHFLSACIRQTPEQCLFPTELRAYTEAVVTAAARYVESLGVDIPCPLWRLPRGISPRRLLASLNDAVTADDASHSGSSVTEHGTAVEPGHHETNGPGAPQPVTAGTDLRTPLFEAMLESALIDIFAEDCIGQHRVVPLAFTFITEGISPSHATKHDRLLASLRLHGFSVSQTDLKKLLVELKTHEAIQSPQNPRRPLQFSGKAHPGLACALEQLFPDKNGHAIPSTAANEAADAALLSLGDAAADIRLSIDRLQTIFGEWQTIVTKLLDAAKAIDSRGPGQSLAQRNIDEYEDKILANISYRPQICAHRLSGGDDQKRFKDAINDAWKTANSVYFCKLDSEFRGEATRLCAKFRQHEPLFRDAALGLAGGARLMDRAEQLISTIEVRIPTRQQIFGSGGMMTVKKHVNGKHVDVRVMTPPTEACAKLLKLLDKIAPLPKIGGKVS